MIRSIPGEGEGQDLSPYRSVFLFHFPGPGPVLSELVGLPPGPSAPFPEWPCPCKVCPPLAVTNYMPQGQPFSTKSINPVSVQNQCPFISANALITGTSLAVTYLSHYTLIVRGNFEQIDE